MKLLGYIFKKFFGWTISYQVVIPDKCVICAAPHTSNWDFLIGFSLFISSTGKYPRFLMKKEWFFFPLGNILRSIGGIPVNRDKKSSLSHKMAELLRSETDFQLAISPEGTRKGNPKWKTGFYHIAEAASLPIVLAHIDYLKKEFGIHTIFQPTGNIDHDIREIKEYYKAFHPKYPEHYVV